MKTCLFEPEGLSEALMELKATMLTEVHGLWASTASKLAFSEMTNSETTTPPPGLIYDESYSDGGGISFQWFSLDNTGVTLTVCSEDMRKALLEAKSIMLADAHKLWASTARILVLVGAMAPEIMSPVPGLTYDIYENDTGAISAQWFGRDNTGVTLTVFGKGPNRLSIYDNTGSGDLDDAGPEDIVKLARSLAPEPEPNGVIETQRDILEGFVAALEEECRGFLMLQKQVVMDTVDFVVYLKRRHNLIFDEYEDMFQEPSDDVTIH